MIVNQSFQMPLRLEQGTEPISTSAAIMKRAINKNILLALFFLFAVIPCTRSHSQLTNPRPYGRGCKGCAACPPYIQWNTTGHGSFWQGTTEWRRGSFVDVSWEKNNHNGGFTRLSLVPESQMFNRSAHSHLSFYFTCWEHGAYHCSQSHECGSDLTGIAFRRKVFVPAVIPDGEYILGFLWFGGVDWRRNIGRFADYTSCARVRIKGGDVLNNGSTGYTPKFEPGPGGSSKHHGKCYTSATAPGICTHGCNHIHAGYRIPWQFDKQHGYTLPILKPKDFLTPSRGEHADVKRNDNEDKNKYAQDPGICVDDVCCASSCSACHEDGCDYRTGGKDLCCPSRIRVQDRRCITFGAPCKMH